MDYSYQPGVAPRSQAPHGGQQQQQTGAPPPIGMQQQGAFPQHPAGASMGYGRNGAMPQVMPCPPWGYSTPYGPYAWNPAAMGGPYGPPAPQASPFQQHQPQQPDRAAAKQGFAAPAPPRALRKQPKLSQQGSRMPSSVGAAPMSAPAPGPSSEGVANRTGEGHHAWSIVNPSKLRKEEASRQYQQGLQQKRPQRIEKQSPRQLVSPKATKKTKPWSAADEPTKSDGNPPVSIMTPAKTSQDGRTDEYLLKLLRAPKSSVLKPSGTTTDGTNASAPHTMTTATGFNSAMVSNASGKSSQASFQVVLKPPQRTLSANKICSANSEPVVPVAPEPQQQHRQQLPPQQARMAPSPRQQQPHPQQQMLNQQWYHPQQQHPQNLQKSSPCKPAPKRLQNNTQGFNGTPPKQQQPQQQQQFQQQHHHQHHHHHQLKNKRQQEHRVQKHHLSQGAQPHRVHYKKRKLAAAVALPARPYNAQQTKAVMGEQDFQTVRSLIMKQQEQFLHQVWELHRIYRLQRLIMLRGPEEFASDKPHGNSLRLNTISVLPNLQQTHPSEQGSGGDTDPAKRTSVSNEPNNPEAGTGSNDEYNAAALQDQQPTGPAESRKKSDDSSYVKNKQKGSSDEGSGRSSPNDSDEMVPVTDKGSGDTGPADVICGNAKDNSSGSDKDDDEDGSNGKKGSNKDNSDSNKAGSNKGNSDSDNNELPDETVLMMWPQQQSQPQQPTMRPPMQQQQPNMAQQQPQPQPMFVPMGPQPGPHQDQQQQQPVPVGMYPPYSPYPGMRPWGPPQPQQQGGQQPPQAMSPQQQQAAYMHHMQMMQQYYAAAQQQQHQGGPGGENASPGMPPMPPPQFAVPTPYGMMPPQAGPGGNMYPQMPAYGPYGYGGYGGWGYGPPPMQQPQQQQPYPSQSPSNNKQPPQPTAQQQQQQIPAPLCKPPMAESPAAKQREPNQTTSAKGAPSGIARQAISGRSPRQDVRAPPSSAGQQQQRPAAAAAAVAAAATACAPISAATGSAPSEAPQQPRRKQGEAGPSAVPVDPGGVRPRWWKNPSAVFGSGILPPVEGGSGAAARHTSHSVSVGGEPRSSGSRLRTGSEAPSIAKAPSMSGHLDMTGDGKHPAKLSMKRAYSGQIVPDKSLKKKRKKKKQTGGAPGSPICSDGSASAPCDL